MEELQARHRTERKDLQGRITQKKKNATKKTRKGINDECERLERDLADRQKAEVDAIEGAPLNNESSNLEIEDETDSESEGQPMAEPVPRMSVRIEASTVQRSDIQDGEQQRRDGRSKKPNRQKARLARRAAEQEATAALAAEEAANLPDLREKELTAMKQQMELFNLTETYIRPDGHCLYSACAVGIPKEKVKAKGPYSDGYQNVRDAAADFISRHPDDFAAFLEEPLDTYVKKIKDTAEWGGQLELQAIARSFNVTINVLQADGRVEKIQSDTSHKEEDGDVWLAYYRHSFGLGEHYNALQKRSAD